MLLLAVISVDDDDDVDLVAAPIRALFCVCIAFDRQCGVCILFFGSFKIVFCVDI